MGTSEKRTIYCNFTISATKCSKLLDVSHLIHLRRFSHFSLEMVKFRYEVTFFRGSYDNSSIPLTLTLCRKIYHVPNSAD